MMWIVVTAFAVVVTVAWGTIRMPCEPGCTEGPHDERGRPVPGGE